MEITSERGPLPRAPQAAPRATHSRAPPDALPRELLGAQDPGNAFQADPQRMGPVLGRVGPRSHLVAARPPPPTHWGFPAARCPGYCVGIPTESSVGVPTQYPGQRVAGNAPMRCQILSNPLRIMANAFQGAPNALPRAIGILAAHSRAPPNALPRGPELLGILNVFFPPPQQAGAGRGPKSAPATPGSPRTPGAKKRIRVS